MEFLSDLLCVLYIHEGPLHESTISAPLLENEPLVSKSVSRVVMNSAAYFRLGFGSAKNMGSLMVCFIVSMEVAVYREFQSCFFCPFVLSFVFLVH